MIEVERICLYMRGKPAPPGVVLARIAVRQHGVVSRPQILALGVDRAFIDRALAAGRLHPVHAGVYAVGHRDTSQDGRWMAAVLGSGEDAVLAYFSAGQKLGIIERYRGSPHVLVKRGHADSAPGIDLHRTRHLPPEQRTERDGIPLTTPRPLSTSPRCCRRGGCASPSRQPTGSAFSRSQGWSPSATRQPVAAGSAG